MGSKSRFVAARFEPEQQRKLLMLSVRAGQPGNMSAALRFAVDRIATDECASVEAISGYQQPESSRLRAEKEGFHA